MYIHRLFKCFRGMKTIQCRILMDERCSFVSSEVPHVLLFYGQPMQRWKLGTLPGVRMAIPFLSATLLNAFGKAVTAFDVGQALTQAQRNRIWQVANNLGVWVYVEPQSMTPTWDSVKLRENHST